ncbi:MAG: hypothetical protein MMC23_007251 [Stictis urceolatum]|nr:hypothetical protein [Stictis urceolata]
MSLVGYSDSEASSEEDPTPKASVKPSTAGKQGIQKVVDSSNPRKIRVNLPEPSQSNAASNNNAEEPPAKRARTGGGLSGFNSMLPAPKQPAAASAGGGAKGLGKGVNLKTAAAPGFSREPISVPEADFEDAKKPEATQNGQDKDEAKVTAPTTGLEPPKEPAKKGIAMMFKPLSVVRKPKKKKANVFGAVTVSTTENSSTKVEPTQVKESKPRKVSLFSSGTTESYERPPTESTGEYQPMMYHTESSETTDPPETTAATTTNQSSQQSPTGPQSLDTIASDLNLSASARRQLFGRGGKGAQAIKVTNFNTDEEWKANEELRAAGDQVQHNPVRMINPGKHSLKQLVNQVSNQRDAFEDSFAAGKANKKEAGSRYGW